MLVSRFLPAACLASSVAALASSPPISLQVPPGYEVVRIAAPPVTTYPVMGNFDDRGRLFVAENAGVNLNDKQLDEKTPSHVRMLEDTDGDGIFDRSTIFADKMTFPQGALWHDGGLYVASPPSIWRLEDTDGDGKADVRKELAKGFKYTGNAADVHGPFLHPNGRIYWCHGRKGHEVRQHDGALVAKGLAARIWSMRPDGTDIQVHASGGMDNPAEVTFNQEGEVFGTVNIFLRGPRADALVHWVHGAAFPHYETAIAELKKTGPLLDAMALIGHVAPAGVTLLRSETWEPALRGNLVWAEFNTRRIMRATVEPRGSSFRATPAVFASSADSGVHFTDVFEDADGSLIVIDTGAWFRQGCPTSGVARPEFLGGIYRIRRSGTRVADPRGLAIAWASQTPAALVDLLADARPAVRDRALAELGARGGRVIGALTVALRDQRHLVRSNAVWALTRIGTPEAAAAARAALRDRDPRVRQVAAQSAFVTRDATAVASLLPLLQDEAPAVRREAARTLGRTRDAAAIPALAQATVRSEDDPVLSHALIYALLEIDAPAATRPLLQAPEPAIRRAALLVLGQSTEGGLEPAVVFDALKSNHLALRATALQLAIAQPAWAPHAAQHLRGLFAGAASAARDQVAPALLATFLGAAEVRDWLAANVKAVPPVMTFDAIAATPATWDDRWRQWLSDGLRSASAAVAQAALRAVTTHRKQDFTAELRDVARDPARSAAFRVAALQAAAGPDRPLEGDGFRMLLEPFRTGGSAESRQQSAAVLRASKLTREQLLELVDLVPLAGPMELPELLGAFQRGPAEADIGRALLEKVQRAPARFGLTAAILRSTFNRYPNGPQDVMPLVAEALERGTAQSARVVELEKLAVTGDAERGRKAFNAGAGACISCHRVSEVGGKIGPDLTSIGRIRELRDLVESIGFPDATIAQGYEGFRVDTKGGETLVGTIARENADHVVLVTIDGREHTIARGTVARIEPHPSSLMPAGLDRAMDAQTLADMLVFLKSLK